MPTQPPPGYAATACCNQTARLLLCKHLPPTNSNSASFRNPLLPMLPGLSTTFLEPCNGYFWVGRIYTDIWRDRER